MSLTSKEHLYGLTYDEVLIIDPTPPFTQEEYEKEEKLRVARVTD